MKVNKLHPRNPHHGPYNLAILSDANPALKQHIIQNPKGEDTINFFEAEAVFELNKALLYQYYQIDHWTIPKGYLCPPIPGRADYIHYLADLINGDKEVNCLDIGTGANCIYPIIGCSEYNWNFVGSELDQKAFDNALKIIERNSALKHKINLRKSPNNAKEWIKLSRLYARDNNHEETMKTLQDALEKIEPSEVTEGKLSDIVI